MALTNALALGKNSDGELIRIGVADSGATDGQGNTLWLLGTLSTVPTEVAPAGQATTNSYVVVSGSQIDTGYALTLSYTVRNSDAANSISWEVFGANASDYSDAVVVNGPNTLTALASGSYAVTPAPYRYYEVKVKSTSSDTPGTAVVHGIAKS